jgi:hypothetical protein
MTAEATSTTFAQTLDLANLDDTGFDKLYREGIEPLLAARESERIAGVSKFWWRAIPGSILVVVLVIIFISIGLFDVAIIGGIALAVGVGAFAYWPLSSLNEQVKAGMLTTISEKIGCTYSANGFAPIAIDRVRTLGLIPGCDRSSFEDWFNGQRFKCGFDLYEAHLEQKHQTKNGTRWVTVFRGYLLRVSFPKSFLGTTVVRRDRGLFNFLDHFGSKLQRVGLVDSKFEREFEVYGSDQVEARELVHPVFMERLLALESKFDGKRIRCAFEEGDLLLAVEGRNRFEAGSMFSPLANPARVRAIVNDIGEILRLIDSMLTAERAPLYAIGNTNVPTEKA